MGIVKSKQTDKMTTIVEAWRGPLAEAAGIPNDPQAIFGLCGVKDENLHVQNPDLGYRALACEDELLLVKPGICKFVPTQSQCLEWEEFACFCLQRSPPEPEPESEEETTDPT